MSDTIYFTCECGVECADKYELTSHLDKVIDTGGLCWRGVELWMKAHLRAFKGNRQNIDHTTYAFIRVMKQLYGKE